MKLFYRIAFIVIALSSCGRQEALSVTAGKMQVQGAAATFPAPLYEKWIDTYRGQNRELGFRYEQYPDSEKAKALKDVVAWGLTEGQKYAEELRYIPLPQNVVSRALEVVNRS